MLPYSKDVSCSSNTTSMLVLQECHFHVKLHHLSLASDESSWTTASSQWNPILTLATRQSYQHNFCMYLVDIDVVQFTLG